MTRFDDRTIILFLGGDQDGVDFETAAVFLRSYQKHPGQLWMSSLKCVDQLWRSCLKYEDHLLIVLDTGEDHTKWTKFAGGREPLSVLAGCGEALLNSAGYQWRSSMKSAGYQLGSCTKLRRYSTQLCWLVLRIIF